jgi:hypothetical protein
MDAMTAPKALRGAAGLSAAPPDQPLTPDDERRSDNDRPPRTAMMWYLSLHSKRVCGPVPGLVIGVFLTSHFA